MRIALVGPTHPFKGGVAAHTTLAAHELAAAGHDVALVSWSHLYPAALYPGEQKVPEGKPDVPVFPGTTRPLRWFDPLSWLRAGRAARSADLLVLVAVIPAQVPGLMTILRAARRRRGGPKIVVVAHNVQPHETHPGGRPLMAWLLRAADVVVVHTEAQAALAREIVGTKHSRHADVRVVPLPQFMPGGLPARTGPELAAARPPRGEGEPVRVLAFGLVRPYKGYDLLLEAAREVPGVVVDVVGEAWGEAGEKVAALAADPALAGRSTFDPRYLAGVDVPGLLARYDVLALPYRDATGSQNVLLGHAHGMPVLATRVATFAEDVTDGVDGLLVPPKDVPALSEALRQLAAPGVLEKLRAGVPARDLHRGWADYVTALTR